MTKAVAYFQDQAMTQRIEADEMGDIFFDMIETPIGQIKISEVWVKNMAEDPVQLTEPYAIDPRLKIASYPKVLALGGLGKIVLEFNDPDKRLKALNTKWGFKRVIIG